MEKYALLHEQLLWEGVAEEEDFFAPAKVSIADASLAHDRGYVEAFVGLH